MYREVLALGLVLESVDVAAKGGRLSRREGWDSTEHDKNGNHEQVGGTIW